MVDLCTCKRIFNYRIFKQFLSFILIFTLISSFDLLFNASFSQERLAVTHGPYLIDPAENGITVVWFTNKRCVSRVEYTTDPKNVYNSTVSIHQGLVDAYTTEHTIRITGLEAGKTYSYRVVSKEFVTFKPYQVVYGDSIVSAVYTFKTLDTKKTDFSFGIVNDIHQRAGHLDSLLQRLSWENIDIFFYNGDLVDYYEDESLIFSGFLDVSVQRFAKNIPFVYIRGNHDTRGNFARNLMQYFPHSSGRFYYSFNHGLVHFIILDSGEDKRDDTPVYAGLVDFDAYRQEQAVWLKEEVKSESFKNSLYRIVIFHIPPFISIYGSQYLTKEWVPILNTAGIDLVINAHTHRYGRTQPTEGRNSFINLILGNSEIAQVDVSRRQLSITVLRKDGSTVDVFSVPPQKR